MLIAGRRIGSIYTPFIICEAGLNHNGSVSQAIQMIRAAKMAGADAIKFQTYRTSKFCRPDDPMYTTFEKCELYGSDVAVLKAECDRRDILFMSTPQNPEDLDLLLRFGIPVIKVGSDDLTNTTMLKYCSRDDVGLPLILSTGMSEIEEIREALKVTGFFSGNPVALLVCTSQYPCPPAEANLLRIRTLHDVFEVPVGFSDHTVGSQAACAAVALGACIFEKHFTLDHGLMGPDHWYSTDPLELTQYVSDIHATYSMLGTGFFDLTEKERAQKLKYQRKTGERLRGVA